MKILNCLNIAEIIGKKIAFIHAAQYAHNITIATEDGYVAVITQDFKENDFDYHKRTRVLSEPFALRYIEEQSYIRNELGKLGIFDIEQYKQKQFQIEKERKEKALQEIEKREWREYLRLKEKYERESK